MVEGIISLVTNAMAEATHIVGDQEAEYGRKQEQEGLLKVTSSDPHSPLSPTLQRLVSFLK